MGQSVNTTAFLTASKKTWVSKWFNNHNYSYYIHEDLLIRQYLQNITKKLNIYSSKCIIRRSKDNIYIYINLYKNIGKRNKETVNTILNKNILFNINKTLSKLTKKNVKLYIYLTNNFDSSILAKYIVDKLEKRISFSLIFNRILIKIKNLKTNNEIKGLRIQCAGRPTGHDRASLQWFKNGPIPLHSYKEKIDYTFTTALTKYGLCGVKVWISHL